MTTIMGTTMKTTLSLAALLAVALPLSAQDFRWSGTIAAGKTLEIRGINGPIRATAARGKEALVTATKKARRSDPDEVEIKVVEHSGGVTICAVYPSGRRGRTNDCRPDGGGHNDTDNNDVEVAFEVQVPAGVEYEATTVNGDVSAEGLTAEVELSTVNGDVDITTTGLAEASTVNGSINARLGRGDWRGELEFTTVNGSITVSLPSGLGADVKASTVNGAIESDFPITMSGRMNPRSLRGRIGDGGRSLELTTVNGGIRIRKAS
jgi:DUF4097 and DUF4098 domain-containing protein YvlB